MRAKRGYSIFAVKSRYTGGGLLLRVTVQYLQPPPTHKIAAKRTSCEDSRGVCQFTTRIAFNVNGVISIKGSSVLLVYTHARHSRFARAHTLSALTKGTEEALLFMQ